MRVRPIVAIALLLLPAASSAQRFPTPLPGGRRPSEPVPLPRQPEPIARQVAYQRSRSSVESYPMISRIVSPGFTDGTGRSSWMSFGVGTRGEYRFNRFVAGTLDLTALGGVVQMESMELGVRLHRERTHARAYPFVDVRLGHTWASDVNLTPIPTATAGSRWPRGTGFGGVVGVGTEYALSPTFSLTTGAALTRNQLNTRDFRSGVPVDRSFALTSYRLIVGLRYNPVHLVMPQGTNTP